MNDFSERRDIILFSTADWDWPYWTNKQHTAVGLAERGARVLYVETVGLRPPRLTGADVRRIARRLWLSLRGIRRVRERVWVLSPLTVPFGHSSSWVRRFNSWQLRLRLRSWLRRMRAGRPLAWTYHPYMLDAATAVAATPIVYHCVDDLGAIPGIDRATFATLERALIARADCIFATSTTLRDHCAALAPTRTHYFRNVADVAHFAQARASRPLPADLAAIPAPRIGYIGVLSELKTDFDLVASIAHARPDWHLVFIGGAWEGQPHPALSRLQALPNVHVLGWRPYALLPDYLRGIDVGLLPQQANDYTKAMFPMKFFEYLAAGCPVVATPLPALAEFRELHQVASDAAGFIKAINTALAEKQILPLDHPVLNAHLWDRRLSAMLAIVDHPAGGDEQTRRQDGDPQ